MHRRPTRRQAAEWPSAAEVRSAETRSAETRSAETHSAEIRSAETRSAETRRPSSAGHAPARKEIARVNKVMLTGRLTRDPELRVTAGGKPVTTFSLATNEYAGKGKEKAEYHTIVTWDRLAEICGRYLGKGQQVAVEGRIQTRSWDDDRGTRHWKTEIVALNVEMLSGRTKKDYQAEVAADSLETQADRMGLAPELADDGEDAEDGTAAEAIEAA